MGLQVVKTRAIKQTHSEILWINYKLVRGETVKFWWKQAAMRWQIEAKKRDSRKSVVSLASNELAHIQGVSKLIRVRGKAAWVTVYNRYIQALRLRRHQIWAAAIRIYICARISRGVGAHSCMAVGRSKPREFNGRHHRDAASSSAMRLDWLLIERQRRRRRFRCNNEERRRRLPWFATVHHDNAVYLLPRCSWSYVPMTCNSSICARDRKAPINDDLSCSWECSLGQRTTPSCFVHLLYMPVDGRVNVFSLFILIRNMHLEEEAYVVRFRAFKF